MATVPNIPSTWGGLGPSSYCNSVLIFSSPWEFHFEFAQQAPVTGSVTEAGIQAQIQQHVISRMAMSPQHAKAFLKVLSDNISGYEKQFGEIPVIVPPEAGPAGGEQDAAS